MGNFFTQLRHQASDFFRRLNTQQKLILLAGMAVGLAIIILVLVWTSGSQYEVLYSGLSQKDAGEIIDKLKEKKVDYQLKDGGSTILVPAGDVYELRLQFAREGLPETSVVGYEIFDKTNLGMTDFIQKLNYRRALEGELTRTIEQIEAVEKARVHIVIPERTLFQEDQQEPSASVIVKLRRGYRLAPVNVQGITHLLASSVEGLKPENVTVIDTRGRVLSHDAAADNMVAMSTTQLEVTKKVEDYLTQKAQSMLDQVLGPGNAVVRVSAQLDFTQVEKTIEEYDPDNTAVRSEEISEQVSPAASGTSAAGSTTTPASRSTSTITNYEVNKTIQHIVESGGSITRLSVAVLVNNKKQVITGPGGKQEVKYVPRSSEELNTLAEIVKRAVGFQEERRDQISVTNVDFRGPSLEEDIIDIKHPTNWNRIYNIIERVFIVLAILISMLIMRSLFNQVKQRSEELQGQIRMLQGDLNLPQLPAGEPQNQPQEDELIRSDQFFSRLGQPKELNLKIRQYIQENPEAATNLLKLWLMEEEHHG